MKRFCTGVIVAVFAAAATAAAQAPQSPANPGAAPPAQDRPAPPPAAAQDKPSTVTFSGCIQNAPAPAGAAAADKKETFVLASVKPVGASATAVGTTGSATRYELDGSSAELTKHLNHQVEITGSIQSSAASPAGAPGSAAAAPKLKVTSIKMVSDKCS